MRRVGVVGLGDMGSGLAKNLLSKGFPTVGFDIDATRLRAFADLGGKAAKSSREVGANADSVFVMVLDAAQARSVLFGDDGLVRAMAPGSAILLTATIKPAEAREIARDLEGSGIDLVDAPVSGGFAGAQTGTLTIMAACSPSTLEAQEPVLAAVGKRIFHVGLQAGDGQTIKACLQALIGSIYTATFESAVLAAKSGIKGKVLFDVFTASAASSPITNNALQKILDRTFVDTGSRIATMYKDLSISLDLARELGVPLFTAATAMQLFQAGKTRFPLEDNWCVTKIIEENADTQVKW